ncbi:MAG: WbqC family protein, partial [Parabacteroides sp.]|nr:WbqC family protein [Parabacteroides sp.]
MKPAYISTAYLGPVQQYSKMFHFPEVRIETSENYLKQSYRNRCIIAGANGPLPLSVPIVKPDTLKCLTKDIRISDHGNWRHLHWNAIVSAYNSTPFFEYYEDDFAPFYEKKYEFLFDFNEELRMLICQLLDIQPQIQYTTSFEADVENDFRWISPKQDIADPSFLLKPYYQVFQDKHG